MVTLHCKLHFVCTCLPLHATKPISCKWRKTNVQLDSGVDGDDLPSSSSDHKDSFQAFCENVQKLHIW